MIQASQLKEDERVVLTLDAGGTSFRFTAMQAGAPITEAITMPSRGDDLESCLAGICQGFSETQAQCPTSPAAISFAFPGPADYPRGIIGDLGNLPGFRGGVALGPMLENHFRIPVFINNDGDLFTYGEAIAGLLPQVNHMLEQAGNTKRYRVLFGATLGTGFGGGLVRDGELFLGDNSGSAEVWLLRNKLHPEMNVEESVSIRAVRRVYAELAGLPFDSAPDPKTVLAIGMGIEPGNRDAAIESYRQLGEVVGDAIGAILTLVDGLVVFGGGVSGAHELFFPALVEELKREYRSPNGSSFPRLASRVFNLEDPSDLTAFLKGDAREITIPGGSDRITYDAMARVGVGVSALETSKAVAIGAYAFALQELDRKGAGH